MSMSENGKVHERITRIKMEVKVAGKKARTGPEVDGI